MDEKLKEQDVVFEGGGGKNQATFQPPSEEQDLDPNYDPYGQLGYGFEAYFKIM